MDNGNWKKMQTSHFFSSLTTAAAFARSTRLLVTCIWRMRSYEKKLNRVNPTWPALRCPARVPQSPAHRSSCQTCHVKRIYMAADMFTSSLPLEQHRQHTNRSSDAASRVVDVTATQPIQVQLQRLKVRELFLDLTTCSCNSWAFFIIF